MSVWGGGELASRLMDLGEGRVVLEGVRDHIHKGHRALERGVGGGGDVGGIEGGVAGGVRVERVGRRESASDGWTLNGMGRAAGREGHHSIG